ncbi:MAG: PEGA domain-containing protein [Sandaracinaceae bacterium]
MKRVPNVIVVAVLRLLESSFFVALRTPLLATAVLTAGSLVAAPAMAQAGMGEAERYFADGERLYGTGDYESSLASFQRAYDLLEGNPNRFLVLFNIGRCQEGVFRYREAMLSYQQFISVATSGPIQEARQRMIALQADLATLQISSSAAATVWIDDHDTGERAPGNVQVSSGRHVVELRARGYAPGRQDVQIAPRTVVPLSFSLESTFSGLSPAFALTVGGLALASIGVGVGFGAVAMGERSTLDDRLASMDPRERFQVTQSAIDAMQQNALIADVLFAVGGGLAIAAVVMLFLTDWGGDAGGTATGPTLTPYASDTEIGLSLRGAL